MYLLCVRITLFLRFFFDFFFLTPEKDGGKKNEQHPNEDRANGRQNERKRFRIGTGTVGDKSVKDVSGIGPVVAKRLS